MFKTEDLMNSKQQYLQEVETIHKKAREMAKLFRVKTRSDKSENRPAAPQTKATQQKILIPRQKLQEIDINTLANNMHKKTHLQIKNRAAMKIQAAFRFYLRNKAKRGIKKNHVTGKAKNKTKAIVHPRLSNKAIPKENKIDVKKVIKIQRAFREYIARKKIFRIRNGLLKLKRLIIEKRIRNAFQQISTSKQSKAKILKRVNEVLRIKKMRNIVTAKMNYQKLRMISKSDGKYKMAESYSLSYRQIQIFYAWLLITGGVELK